LDDKLAAIAQAQNISPQDHAPDPANSLNQPNQPGLDSKTNTSNQVTGSTSNASQPHSTFDENAADFQFKHRFSQFKPPVFNTANAAKPESHFPGTFAPSGGSAKSSTDRQAPEDIGESDRDDAAESEAATTPEPQPPEPIAWEVWAYLERQRKDTLRHVKTFESEWKANRFLEQAERERKAGLKVHYEIRAIFAPDPDEFAGYAQEESSGDRPDVARNHQTNQAESEDQDDSGDHDDAIDVEVIVAPASDADPADSAPNVDPETSREPAANRDRHAQQSAPQSVDQAHVETDMDINTANPMGKARSKTDADPRATPPSKSTTPRGKDLEIPPKTPIYQSEPKVETYTNIARPFADAQNLPDLEDLELDSWAADPEEIEAVMPDRLTQAELAQHLGVSSSTLNRYKFNPGFTEWCKKHPKQQPLGEAWQYDPGDDRFHRLD
jgi:hypothetical protein